MILLNAPAKFCGDALAETIIQQNPNLNLTTDDFKPIYKTDKRDLPECHWVVSVSIRKIFQSQSIDCRDIIDNCAHCAVKGHKSEVCSSKDKPAICANCTREKNPNNHSVRNELCPVYLSATKTNVRKTNYQKKTIARHTQRNPNQLLKLTRGSTSNRNFNNQGARPKSNQFRSGGTNHEESTCRFGRTKSGRIYW